MIDCLKALFVVSARQCFEGVVLLWMPLSHVDVKNRRVIVRVDYNVPLDSKGNVLDDTRIKASLETIQYLLRKGCLYIVLISHLGRPKGVDKKVSLKKLVPSIENLLQERVVLVPSIEDFESVRTKNPDARIFLLENIRFFPGELKNSKRFARQLAKLGELYVNEAFSACHRKHASVEALPRIMQSVPGFQLQREVQELSRLLTSSKKPFIAIIAGAKLSTKLKLIKNLLPMVDYLLVGGAMIFTFYKAQGLNVGNNKVEAEFLRTARRLLQNPKLALPKDVVIIKSLRSKIKKPCHYTMIPDHYLALDIGPESVDKFKQLLSNAKTVFWNGPLGYIEDDRFAMATKQIAEFLALKAEQGSKVVVGGGDTLWFLKQQGLLSKYSFVSTGGGASLAFLAGETLPGLKALGFYSQSNARNHA